MWLFLEKEIEPMLRDGTNTSALLSVLAAYICVHGKLDEA